MSLSRRKRFTRTGNILRQKEKKLVVLTLYMRITYRGESTKGEGVGGGIK